MRAKEKKMDWATASKIIVWAPTLLIYGAKIRQAYETVMWVSTTTSAGISLIRHRWVRQKDDAWVLLKSKNAVQ